MCSFSLSLNRLLALSYVLIIRINEVVFKEHYSMGLVGVLAFLTAHSLTFITSKYNLTVLVVLDAAVLL